MYIYIYIYICIYIYVVRQLRVKKYNSKYKILCSLSGRRVLKEVKLEKFSTNTTILKRFMHIFRLSHAVARISFRDDGVNKSTPFVISS